MDKKMDVWWTDIHPYSSLCPHVGEYLSIYVILQTYSDLKLVRTFNKLCRNHKLHLIPFSTHEQWIFNTQKQLHSF